MGVKKHNWMKQSRQGMICKVEVFDEDGRQLDTFKWNVPDKESEKKIFTILKNAYGVFKQKEKQEDSNILKKGFEW